MRQLVSTLRHRPAPLVGVFIALLAAAAVMVMTFSMGMSGSTSKLPVSGLARAAVVVTGSPNVTFHFGHGDGSESVPLSDYRRLPASVVQDVRKIPGVQTAITEQTMPVTLLLPDGAAATGSFTGEGWESAALAPFSLVSGRAPAGPHELVVGAGAAHRDGLHIGDEVRLVGTAAAPFRIVGVASAPSANTDADYVFFSGAEAAALYGHPGQADLIGVVARPGVRPSVLEARVRAAVAGKGLTVVAGSGRGAAADPSARYELSNLSSLVIGGALDLVLIALFVVASTVALSVSERARAMALLRAVGATPAQVRRMVMTELAVLAALAGVIAYLPGTWLASMSVRGLANHQFVPPTTRAWTNPIELPVAIGGAIVVAELAGFFAARRASRIHPTAALGEAMVERRSPRPARLLLGLLALGGGVALAYAVVHQHDASQQLSQSELTLLLFLIAIAFLGPYLLRLAEAALRLPVRLLGRTSGRLANAQLRTRSRRMASALVAITLPISFAGAIVAVDATQTHADAAQARGRLAASAVVTAPGPGLDPSALAAVREQPGVTGAVGLSPTTVYVPFQGAETTAAEAVTPGPLTSLVHLDVTSGSLARFGPGDIALSRLIAGQGALHTHIGQQITTYLADGTPYRATVTAIYSRSLGFGDAIVPTGAAGGGHLGTTKLGEILVDTSAGGGATATGTADGPGRPAVASTEPAGASAAHLLARNLKPIWGNSPLNALDALAGRYPGLQVASRSVANAQAELTDSQDSYANNLLLAFLGALAAIALANTLVLTTLQGAEELALLRRVGVTVRELIVMTAWQAAQLTGVGVILGTGAAAVGVMSATKALTGSWAPTIPWGPDTVIVGSVVGLTALAMLVPSARIVSRGADR